MAGGGGGGDGVVFSPSVVERAATAVDAVVVAVAGNATASARMDLLGIAEDVLRLAAAVSPAADCATPAGQSPNGGTLTNGEAARALVL